MNRWFNSLPRRDQIVLVVGGLCTSVILVWALLMMPLADAVERETQNYENSKRILAEVKSLTAEYQQYQASGAGQTAVSTSSLDSIVTRAINQNNLSFTSKIPSGNNQLSVRFEDAKFENIMQWLYDLEVGQGVQVENITLTASGQPGHVMASVRLVKN